MRRPFVGTRNRKAMDIFANPPAPYSIQKCPNFKPQMCQKFVPAIVFRGSNQGDPNLSNKKKRQFPDKFSNFRQSFDKFRFLLLEPRKTIAGTNF